MNKEIADRLQIGLTTVISHRRNIMEKLGIRSVAGLAIYAHDGRICRGRRALNASSQIRIAASEIIPLLCS